MSNLFHFLLFLAFWAVSAVLALPTVQPFGHGMVQASRLSSCWWRHSSPLLWLPVLWNLLPCPFVPRQGIVKLCPFGVSQLHSLFFLKQMNCVLLYWEALWHCDYLVLNMFETFSWNLAFSDPFPLFPLIAACRVRVESLLVFVPSGHSSRDFRT